MLSKFKFVKTTVMFEEYVRSEVSINDTFVGIATLENDISENRKFFEVGGVFKSEEYRMKEIDDATRVMF
jgi:hypothetical protein